MYNTKVSRFLPQYLIPHIYEGKYMVYTCEMVLNKPSVFEQKSIACYIAVLLIARFNMKYTPLDGQGRRVILIQVVSTRIVIQISISEKGPSI